MEFTKINSKEIELVNRQRVFKEDLESEKETLEKRLVEINQLIAELGKP